MGRFVDLTGKRFGRWTVIGRAESRMSAGKPVGYYEDYDEAVRVREEAEMQYFGEYRRK